MEKLNEWSKSHPDDKVRGVHRGAVNMLTLLQVLVLSQFTAALDLVSDYLREVSETDLGSQSLG